MEISLFSKCIKSLIGNHDKVEVPGLGIFFAEQVPSTFSQQLNIITPPSRRMFFEKAEVERSAGSLLLNHISSELGVSADQAEVELSWCLGRIRSELDGNRICILPELGRMKATSQHDYFFVPDDELDICPSSFGLTPVCLRQNAENVQDIGTPSPSVSSKTPPAPESGEKFLPELEEKISEQPKDIRSLYEERAKAGLSAKDRRALKIALVIGGITVLLVLTAAALLMFLPDTIVDSILYTPEELKIIHLSMQ